MLCEPPEFVGQKSSKEIKNIARRPKSVGFSRKTLSKRGHFSATLLS